MKALFRSAVTVGALTLLATAGRAAEDAIPTLKSAWKLDLPAGTKRIAIADVTGDKTLRLLTLDGAGVLTVQKVADAGPVKEDTISLGDSADQFAVGRFAKDKPAVIVVPGAVFYRDGDKYAKKAAADIKLVSGTVRFADGVESYMVFDPSQRDSAPQSFIIDLAADNPVKTGPAVPQPDQKPELFRDLSPILPPAMFESAPFPESMKKGAILRLFFYAKSKKIYGLVAWQSATTHLALLNGSDIFQGPNGDLKPIWQSPNLAGKILDIAFGASVKDAKQNGVYLLEQSGDDGKSRQLEFFTIDAEAPKP